MAVLFVVVFLLVLYSPSPSTALFEECSQSDLSTFNTSDLQPALKDQKSSYNTNTYQNSYLQLEKGFRGVGVEVEGFNESTTTNMFFPAYEHCFPENEASWWGVELYCGSAKSSQSIRCYMYAGYCYWECEKNHTSQQDYPELRWISHGPSRWRKTTPPDYCLPREWSMFAPYHDVKCRDLSTSLVSSTTTIATTVYSNTSTTASPHKPLSPFDLVVIVPVALALFLLLVVLFVVLAVCAKRRKRATYPSEPAVAWNARPRTSEGAVTLNLPPLPPLPSKSIDGPEFHVYEVIGTPKKPPQENQEQLYDEVYLAPMGVSKGGTPMVDDKTLNKKPDEEQIYTEVAEGIYLTPLPAPMEISRDGTLRADEGTLTKELDKERIYENTTDTGFIPSPAHP